MKTADEIKAFHVSTGRDKDLIFEGQEDLLRRVENEGDEKSFRYSGYKCYIRRQPIFRHLCGYIRLEESHPLHGMGYDEIEELFEWELPTHGGLTFAGHLVDKRGYWIGFDCAHSDDLTPFQVARQQYLMGYEEYRTVEYVEEAIQRTIDYITQNLIDADTKQLENGGN